MRDVDRASCLKLEIVETTVKLNSTVDTGKRSSLLAGLYP
jgi:hypothetical protein